MQREQMFELAWILPSVAIPVGMLVAILVANFGMGIHLPGHGGTLDPRAVIETAPFDNPGLTQVGPKTYEVAMVAQTWAFRPNEIRVPTGSEVRFVATTVDVSHRLRIQGTNINVMLIPGQVARIPARFDQPGEHLFKCHEYCGIAHHIMAGKVVVEP